MKKGSSSIPEFGAFFYNYPTPKQTASSSDSHQPPTPKSPKGDFETTGQ